MKPQRLSRQQSQEQTRERLLLAAHKLFLKNGYGEATIEDITAEAGFTRGAFYSNFEGKPEVLLELLFRTHESMVGGVQQIAEIKGTPEQIMGELVKYYSKLYHQKDTFLLWGEARLVAMREPEFREKFNAMVEKDHHNLANLISRFAGMLGVSLTMSADAIALGLTSLLDGMHACPITESRENGAELAEQVLAGFLVAVFRPN